MVLTRWQRHSLLAALLCVCGLSAHAQLADAPPGPDAPLEAIPAPKATTPTPAALPAVITQPQWTELNPNQQEALRPLKSHWNKLSDIQQRKWIALARNFGQLPASEKSKLQERMQEWAALSNKERDQARLNFAQTQKVSPEQRLAQWQAYQALDDAAKKALAEQAPKKPKGAALVIKPTKADVLPIVITPKATISATGNPLLRIDPNTLLPLRNK